MRRRDPIAGVVTRGDALATWSEIVPAVERICEGAWPEHGRHHRRSGDRCTMRNVMPGEIAVTMDIRSPSAETLHAIESELRAAATDIAAWRKVEVAIDAI